MQVPGNSLALWLTLVVAAKFCRKRDPSKAQGCAQFTSLRKLWKKRKVYPYKVLRRTTRALQSSRLGLCAAASLQTCQRRLASDSEGCVQTVLLLVSRPNIRAPRLSLPGTKRAFAAARVSQGKSRRTSMLTLKAAP